MKAQSPEVAGFFYASGLPQPRDYVSTHRVKRQLLRFPSLPIAHSFHSNSSGNTCATAFRYFLKLAHFFWPLPSKPHKDDCDPAHWDEKQGAIIGFHVYQPQSTEKSALFAEVAKRMALLDRFEREQR